MKDMMEQKPLLWLALGLLIGGIAVYAYMMMDTSSPSPSPVPPGGVACTLEAKICPDGSAVGRTGPDCEFAPCPGNR